MSYDDEPMTSLYLLPVSESSRLPEAFCRRFFPLRTERASRFRFPKDRLLCLGAGALLHYAGITEESVCFAEYGKPFVPGAERKFSLSHSGDYSLLAVSSSEIGTDLEYLDAGHLSVAKRVLTEPELDWLSAFSGETEEERFLRLWTLKESVSKLLGTGLSLSFSSFSVLPLTEGEGIFLQGRILFGRNLSLPGYGFAVVTESTVPEPEIRFLTAGEIVRDFDE